MFTDMVGYTALGQRNESLSLALVEEQRKVIRPVLARHNGREVKTMGDAFLVEFPNALDAVRCAYDIQRAIREFNLSLATEKRIHLRIGVHVGEVVESQGDISGDAVNVASRIEPLADDGGVCITRQVHDHVHNKLDLQLSSLGQRSLKSVSEPMEVYRVVMPWEKETPGSSVHLGARRIAVLPFVNMSPDPSDLYFADGITEEIISIASNVSGLSVISRTSVMGYKGTTKKIREIGRELEVGSVLEGSFRRSGNKIRVTTQLINVNDDSHLWAQSYDRNLDDVFAVQSDIAKQVAEALKVRILPDERHRIEKAPTESTEAFLLYLKGRYHWSERTESGLGKAIQYFEKAIEKDPKFALAYDGIAESYVILVNHGYVSSTKGHPKVKEYLTKALELDEGLGEAHATLGGLLADSQWAWDQAEKEFQRALALNPSYATAHHWYALILANTGKLREGLDEIEMARSLDPNSLQILSAKGVILYYMHEYGKAARIQEEVLQNDPNFLPGIANLFAPYCELRMHGEAAALVARYMSLVNNSAPTLGPQAQCYARLGKTAEARVALKEAERLGGNEFTSPLSIAMAHYYLGEVELAFEWFERAFEQKDSGLVSLKVDPEYDPLRGDPRFRRLLKNVGLG